MMVYTVLSGFQKEILDQGDATRGLQIRPDSKQRPHPVQPIATLEGPRILETLEDLRDLNPEDTALVPLQAPVAKVVWEWSRACEDDDPSGSIARGTRSLLLAWYNGDVWRMLKSTQTILKALSQMI